MNIRDAFIVDHYCLRFERGVVLSDMDAFIVDHYCLKFDRRVVLTAVDGYIDDHSTVWGLR